MKNFIPLLIGLWLVSGPVNAQVMSWIPSDYVANSQTCQNQSDCDNNIVCYQLQYRPEKSGILTSYTTGFIADCSNGNTSIYRNESCVMSDRSMEVDGCEEYSKLLLHCSGNTGEMLVEAGQPVFLHQVCFQLEEARGVEIIEAEVADLTTAIDGFDGGPAITEFPEFQPFEAQGRHVCNPIRWEINTEVVEAEGSDNTIIRWTPVAETGEGQYQLQESVDHESFTAIETVGDIGYDPYSWQYELATDRLNEAAVYRIQYSSPGTTPRYSSLFNTSGGELTTSKLRLLTLSPNPTQDILRYNFELEAPQEIEIVASDVSGRMYFRRSIGLQTNGQIEVADWPSGVYLLIGKLADGNVLTKSFIKRD